MNPEYQRRSAWNDVKRSKLIESILINYPIPEIVLAEDPKQKKKYAVIDGKQRLLTIAGYFSPDVYRYWDKPFLIDLDRKSNLKNVSYEQLELEKKYSDDLRQFLNASLRCTIITNFKENDVLYDIFYRLNSGSVSLSTQELRQVLNKGEFANYLIATTNALQPLHNVMKLDEPDRRLRDIEVLLRCLSMIMFARNYTGNLKIFLDNSMAEITSDWKRYEREVKVIYDRINYAIEILRKIFFNDYTIIGRKFSKGIPEKRFNRVLLEVQLFYFIELPPRFVTKESANTFIENFKTLCDDNYAFRASIESSTKSIDNYRIRFAAFQELMNKSFGIELKINPFG